TEKAVVIQKRYGYNGHTRLLCQLKGTVLERNHCGLVAVRNSSLRKDNQCPTALEHLPRLNERPGCLHLIAAIDRNVVTVEVLPDQLLTQNFTLPHKNVRISGKKCGHQKNIEVGCVISSNDEGAGWQFHLLPFRLDPADVVKAD